MEDDREWRGPPGNQWVFAPDSSGMCIPMGDYLYQLLTKAKDSEGWTTSTDRPIMKIPPPRAQDRDSPSAHRSSSVSR